MDGYISIHALLAESDKSSCCGAVRLYIFLSTLSLRRATAEFFSIGQPVVFLSTLSLRRATFRQNYDCFEWIISIHALLAESDTLTDDVSAGGKIISIHALLAESDHISGATGRILRAFPRSPCGERHIVL